MFDMLGKLGQMKKAMEEVKSRLDTISVVGESGEGSVRITMTGNLEVKSVEIHDRYLKQERKEELQELTELAMNRAVTQARSVMDSEMKSVSQGLLPGFPGLS